jgi:hypothetical protein
VNEIDQIIAAHWNGSTKAALADLGVSKQAVSYWRKNGIPALRRYHIESVVSKLSSEPVSSPLPASSAPQ